VEFVVSGEVATVHGSPHRPAAWAFVRGDGPILTYRGRVYP
jgi:hypothetical protein